ncbi:MAG: hypothetical protein AABY22_06285 [Nanoarchaeota archaeon]
MALFSKKAKKFKTEGTSQTFGQMVIFGNVPGFNNLTNTQTSISSKTTNVNILKTTVSSAANLDETKVQIAVAAASNDSNATIVLKEQGNSAVGISDVGNLSNTNTLTVSVFDSQTKTKEEVKDILTESKKVDLSISLKSKNSEKIEFNNLQMPQLNGKFNYIFFAEDEADVDSQEDPSKEISEFSRFSNLQWDIVEVSEDLTDEELEKNEAKEINNLKEKIFKQPRGVSGFLDKNFGNSISKSLKNFNLFNLNENIKSEIVDVHKIEKAFDSISNNNIFSNTINTSINVNRSNELLNILAKSVK